MYFVHLYNGRFFRDSRIWSQDHHHKGHFTHCHHYPFLMYFQSSQMSRHQSSGFIQQSQLRLETLETHYASCIATIATYAKIKGPVVDLATVGYWGTVYPSPWAMVPNFGVWPSTILGHPKIPPSPPWAGFLGGLPTYAQIAHKGKLGHFST